MKKIIQTLSLALCTASVMAQTTNIVVPNANANVEGNSSIESPFDSPSFRLQQVFDASQFAIPPGASARIDSIWFRLDGATINNPSHFFGGGSVTMSLTPVGPDGLSSTFANNVGANAVTIFSGAFSFGGISQPGLMPQPFRQTIIATAPFWYIPSQGNLLIDIAGAGGQTFIPGSLDAQFVNGDSVSRVFALNGNSLSGTADTMGLITRFDFTVVPEPATWLMAVLGFVTMFLLRSKRKK